MLCLNKEGERFILSNVVIKYQQATALMSGYNCTHSQNEFVVFSFLYIQHVILNIILFWVTSNSCINHLFLGAQAPLGIARVKNKRTEKFQIAIICSLLLLLAP